LSREARLSFEIETAIRESLRKEDRIPRYTIEKKNPQISQFKGLPDHYAGQAVLHIPTSTLRIWRTPLHVNSSKPLSAAQNQENAIPRSEKADRLAILIHYTHKQRPLPMA
jgi:hypothetical protein